MKKKPVPAKRKAAVPARARLFDRVASILDEARQQTVRSVNTWMVSAYWLIGREIVLEEQGGQQRAAYGKRVLEDLSARMTKRYGRGFSVPNLRNFRDFFLTFQDRQPLIFSPLGRELDVPPIRYKSCSELASPRRTAQIRYPAGSELPDSRRGRIRHKSCGELQPTDDTSPIRYPLGSELLPTEDASQIRHPVGGEFTTAPFHPNLGWSHYRALMRVTNPEARQFYEEEAVRAHWNKRQLERQISTLFYERLLSSRDKKGMLKQARGTDPASHPLDIIRDPCVLEFLRLPESHQLSESELEAALITHIQDFLMELGSGFAFIGRQQRLTLEGDHFYADLVFYHVRLKCYVILDLKTRRLEHADLGQMQLYVNYYDREIAAKDDNPTLGIILCTDKNDSVVRYVLDKDQKKIFASRYHTIIPSEKTLLAEVRREIKALGLEQNSAPAKPARKKKPARRSK